MLFWVCLILIGLYLYREKRQLSRLLSRISVRFHVYGTRGKTTTTLRLYDALRKSGKKVMAKTTGDTPLLYSSNGTATLINRYAPARIHEYIQCLKKARRDGCDAVVFECMAISPESIVIAGNILSPTHVVVTNTRPDHYETMGNSPEAIAQTLSLSVRRGSTVFATEDDGSIFIRQQAKNNDCVFHGLSDQKALPPVEQTNRLLELIGRETGFIESFTEEIGRWPAFELYRDHGGEFFFLDLFSANDVVSSRQLLMRATADESTSPLIILLATRSDRPLRTKVFIDWISSEQDALGVSLITAQGWHAPYASLQLKKKMPEQFLFCLSPCLSPSVLVSLIRARVGERFRLAGLGNTHGYGEIWREYLRSLN